MAYKGINKTILKRIKQQYREGIFSPALSYSGKFWRSGDFIAFTLANHALGVKYGRNGLYFLSVLSAAHELERKTGFFTLFILADVLTKAGAHKHNHKLFKDGFFDRAPFPLEYSHVIRVRKVYKLSEKGREALRYFRSEYMKHQKLSKKARLAMMETLNTF